jgi:hypothetical protein
MLTLRSGVPHSFKQILVRADGHSADGVVRETGGFDLGGVVEVAAVEDHGAGHAAAHFGEVGVAEFAPLGVDGQSVGAFQSVHFLRGVDQLVAVQRADVFHRFGVVYLQPHALFEQAVDQHQRRGFADVVGYVRSCSKVCAKVLLVL